MKQRAALICCTVLLLTSKSWAASFDCAKARTKVEKAICSDPELSELDEELAATYKNALVAHPLPSYVRARQREWLRTLPESDAQRLKREFGSRIAHLKSAGQVMFYSNAKQTFSSDGGDTAVELWDADGKWHLAVWSQGRINTTQGFTCEFEGSITEPFKANGNNLAVSNENERVVFALTDGTFRFEGTPDICIGMGGIAADLKIDRVLRK